MPNYFKKHFQKKHSKRFTGSSICKLEQQYSQTIQCSQQYNVLKKKYKTCCYLPRTSFSAPSRPSSSSFSLEGVLHLIPKILKLPNCAYLQDLTHGNNFKSLSVAFTLKQFLSSLTNSNHFLISTAHINYTNPTVSNNLFF